MIVSSKNQRVKDIRRHMRCKGDGAVLEGPILVGEALAAGLELDLVLATPAFLASAAGRGLVPDLTSPVNEVDARVLDELCDADSPKGLLAVTKLHRGRLDDLRSVPADGVYLYGHQLQDPGNLGALARVAEAFGVSALLLSSNSVHPNHPRALRASAGSLLRLPVAVGVGVNALGEKIAPADLTSIALVPRDGIALEVFRPQPPLLLLLGSEGAGLPEDLIRQADTRLTIPLAEPVESLNVTVAASLVLWQLRQQLGPELSI